MLQYVDIDDLEAGPNPIRSGTGLKAVQALAEQIEESRWVATLTVREGTARPFRVVAGHRRLAALELLRPKIERLFPDGIPVEVLREGFRTVNAVENLGRRDVHPIALAEAMRSELRAGRNQKQVAKLTGYSTSQVSRYVGMLDRLEPEVLEHYRARECTARELIALGWQSPAVQRARLTRGNNPQRSSTRKRSRPAAQVRAELRRVAALPRSLENRAVQAALSWVLGERASTTL